MNLKYAKALGILALFALYPQAGYGAATLLPPGEQCFQAQTGLNGMVGLLGTITGGSGGTAGVYGGIALTGGSGSGATANVTVAGGVVTAVAILNPGTQYVVGDSLSAVAGTIGNVAGFSVPVSSVSINSSLAGGTATFYVPNTTTFKQTWFNADQASNHQNTNPVQLDANGCAIVYGIGSYRQVLKDSLGNTIWDQVTTDTSANNNTFWAGLAGGTPNAITVTDAGFNATDGSIIQFIPISNNTGPTTLNPSGFGAISIVKDTAAGAVALSGGEIVTGSPSNVVDVVYSATQGNFHLLNLVNASAPQSQPTLCGAIGLKIVNNVGTPNTQITLTADQVTTVNNSFQVFSRTNVSYTINITLGTVTSAVNGMDGESPGASAWINLWAIDNGASGGGLASITATAPTMPSGYSYKCRLGAMRVDGAGNLLRTLQVGSRAQYVVTPATNTTAFPTIVSGNTAGGNYVPQATGAFIPPTATSLFATVGWASNAGSSNQYASIAPNANFALLSGGASSPPLSYFTTGDVVISGSSTAEIVLETTNVYFAANNTTSAFLLADGWKDKINAN